MLSAVTSAFVTVLAGFTLVICLLLSAAFTEEQCYAWIGGVGKSIAMQVVVTDPGTGLVVRACVRVRVYVCMFVCMFSPELGILFFALWCGRRCVVAVVVVR